MYPRRDELTRIARAPAKLNLYLEIFGRRADGFHELETLMVPLKLADSVIFTSLPPLDDTRPGQFELEVRECFPASSGMQPVMVPTGDDNLVVRALKLLRQRSGCRMGARVSLVKRIPAAAGLGGGSSDAAAALRLANSAWGLRWPMERLLPVAAEIGSDVPFFLGDGAAVCRGRGEQVTPVQGIWPIHVVIVKPPDSLSTADVYRAHEALEDRVRTPQGGSQFAVSAFSGSWAQPAQWMRNRLQAAAAAVSPWVERLRAAFDKLDFAAQQLSGSGSAYFGVCRNARHARRLAAVLKSQQLGLVYATRSCA
jgi:4-diphosphocytidyl-2-C-methyl-D-erythritol kinase